MNLKKESGKGGANLKDIEASAKKDRCFIKEQLNLYQPDIVIACGHREKLTVSLLKDVIYDDSDSEWKNDVNGLDYYSTEKISKNKSIYVISMPHPNRATIDKWSNLLRELYDVLKNIAK